VSTDPVPPFRRNFDTARDPYAARNALGIMGSGAGFITSVTAPLSVTGGNLTIDLSGYQPLDADLTALAALTGTNTIYYRSAANTWSAVTVGTGLSFTGGTLANTVAAGGNVSNSGTPTVGQYAKWVTATTIQGVAPATVLSDIGALSTTVAAATYAPIASPTFTGDPKAPTPTAGDNDTSVATTAFVTAAISAIPGATTTVTAPQGRLTLQSLTPVMVTTQAAKTTIFYTGYVGVMVPIYNGAVFAMMSIGTEISTTTTDTTKNPAAIGASKVNDWFVWNDAGTLRLCHGPDWSSDTLRSAGTGITAVNGIYINNAAITNACGAGRGTYVGTTRSNASSQLDWILGTADTAGLYSVWNAYNRIDVKAAVRSSTASWTYGSVTVRQPNGSTFWKVSFVSGLEEDGFYTEFIQNGTHSASGYCIPGIGYDSITASAGAQRSRANQIVSNTMHGAASFNSTSLGFHFVSALEYASGGTCTFYGTGNLTSGLEFEFRM